MGYGSSRYVVEILEIMGKHPKRVIILRVITGLKNIGIIIVT